MPPKALSKAQQRKADRERQAEEARQKEIEDARLAEEAEAKRLVKLEKQRLKDQKFADEEKIRIMEEESVVSSIYFEIKTTLSEMLEHYDLREDWNSYISNNLGVSDPKNELEITSQLSKFEDLSIERKFEDSAQDRDDNIKKMINNCQNAEDLNIKLNVIKEMAKIEENPQKVTSCQEYIDKFR